MNEQEEQRNDGSDLLSELLPRLTNLGAVLHRGHLIDRALEAAGVPLERPAMSVLITVQLADRPLRVGEVAARMEVVGPHVTRLVNDLEKRGLVNRVADEHDQRSRLIELTPEGAAATDRYLRFLLDWFAGVLSDWPEQDRQDLGRLLGRFADDIAVHLAAFAD